jgi:hypothetical protein
MNAHARFVLGSTFVALIGLSPFVGCGAPSDDSDLSDSALAAQRAKNKEAANACGIDHGALDPDDEPRACDPGSKKKTTICHIPPGNPANAHTLCIGNPAVGPHVRHHGDYLGPCRVETPCPPPSGGGAGGSPGETGTGGSPGGETGTGGSPGTPGTGGVSGTGGGGGASETPRMCLEGRISCGADGTVATDACPTGTSCSDGCCWRLVE